MKVVSKSIFSQNARGGQYVQNCKIIIEASKSTIENVTRFADRTEQGIIGIIENDKSKTTRLDKHKGINN